MTRERFLPGALPYGSFVNPDTETVDEAHIFLSPPELVYLDTEPSSTLLLEMFSPFEVVGLLSRRAARKRTPHQDCFLTEDKTEQAGSGRPPLIKQVKAGECRPRQLQPLLVSVGSFPRNADRAAQEQRCVTEAAARVLGKWHLLSGPSEMGSAVAVGSKEPVLLRAQTSQMGPSSPPPRTGSHIT